MYIYTYIDTYIYIYMYLHTHTFREGKCDGTRAENGNTIEYMLVMLDCSNCLLCMIRGNRQRYRGREGEHHRIHAGNARLQQLFVVYD